MTEKEMLRLPAGYDAIGDGSTDREGTTFVLVSSPSSGRRLLVRGDDRSFFGDRRTEGTFCPLTPENARALSERFDWLRPQRIPSEFVSFGFGDRLGLATAGHIRSIAGSTVFPLLAQQSVRENTRTGRSFGEVLSDVIYAAFRASYRGGFGADADHLKEIDDALEAAALGFSFFTCDPGDHVVAVEQMSTEEIHTRFEAFPESERLASRFAGKSFVVGDDLVLSYTGEDLERAAIKYGGAVSHAARMFEALRHARPDGFDYEVSVDETDAPTTPREHLFVALELRHRGVEFVSLAPRFVGAMEKGVDWRGDMGQFAVDLRQHALIARSVGGYRLSLHSGSDKFSLYPLFARETQGRCHVKTAGTSYLVALDVIARHDPAFFRKIAQLSLDAFAEDKATYHISADPARIPAIHTVPDAELPRLVSSHDARQVLHVSFGSVLTSPLADGLRSRLLEWEASHVDALAQHLGQHIDRLEVSP